MQRLEESKNVISHSQHFDNKPPTSLNTLIPIHTIHTEILSHLVTAFASTDDGQRFFFSFFGRRDDD
jgi:hypothetical protein